jgi:hypothetical protein
MVRSDEFVWQARDERRRAFLRGSWALGVALSAPAGWALEGGSGLVEAVPGAPWSAVGSLWGGGDRLLSAVAIAPRWVITAAHAVNGARPAEVVFRTALGGGFSARASRVHVHPSFVTGEVDLALVQLEKRVPADMAIAVAYTGELQGQIVQLVSHGGSTTLLSRGENRIDALQADAQGRPVRYLFDHDGPDLTSNVIGPAVPANGSLGSGREATLVSGDSGSAAFVLIDGRWGLAGINTFQATVTPPGATRAGRIAGGMVLGPQLGWILGTLREANAGS